MVQGYDAGGPSVCSNRDIRSLSTRIRNYSDVSKCRALTVAALIGAPTVREGLLQNTRSYLRNGILRAEKEVPESMYNTKAYSAASATSPLASTPISRRDPTDHDEIRRASCRER